LALEQLRFLLQNKNEFVRAESGVEAENLKSGEILGASQNPNPSHTEGFGTPASFSRA
jgi:hypothetical protein